MFVLDLCSLQFLHNLNYCVKYDSFLQRLHFYDFVQQQRWMQYVGCFWSFKITIS